MCVTCSPVVRRPAFFVLMRLTVRIFGLGTLKFTATATEISRDDTIFKSLCDAFTSTHGPTMDLIQNFTDFHMLRLDPDAAVLVLAAKAFRLSGPDFEIVAHLSEA